MFEKRLDKFLKAVRGISSQTHIIIEKLYNHGDIQILFQ